MLRLLFRLIGQHISATPRQKALMVCWTTLPLFLLFIIGCLASLYLSRFIPSLYNPLLFHGLIWGMLGTALWLTMIIIGLYGSLNEQQGYRYQQSVITLFALTNMVSMVLVGPFNLVTGVVLGSSTLIGLLLFSSRQVVVVFLASIFTIAAYAVYSTLAEIHYRPLLSLPENPDAHIWINAMTLAIAVFIVIKDTLITASLTSAWQDREHLTLTRSRQDGLTGVANRSYALNYLTHQAMSLANQRAHLSLVMVDLDHFKQINDQHGHLAGDQILIECCQRMQQCLRHQDILGRFGGEEFIIILPNTNAHNAVEVAKRCQQALFNAPFEINNGHAIRVSASFGVSGAAAHTFLDINSLIEQADQALYLAKRRGKNNVALYRATDS